MKAAKFEASKSALKRLKERTKGIFECAATESGESSFIVVFLFSRGC